MAYLELDEDSRELIDRVLTEKQAKVVKLWASGVSWVDMADQLDKDETTVRGHFRAAMRKLARQPEMQQKLKEAS